MENLTKKSIIVSILTLLAVQMSSVQAESLFKAGISQTASPATPRSWFQSIRATNIGDLVTIVVDESTTLENTVELTSNKKTDTNDEWTQILDDIFPGKGVIPTLDGWGGSSKITNNTSLKRSNTIKQNITTQVVQVMPNGNLVVQGRKSVVNSGERQDIVLTGIVNPRLVNGEGKINSEYVANMQIGIVGKGTVSRAESDGIMNRLLRIFF